MKGGVFDRLLIVEIEGKVDNVGRINMGFWLRFLEAVLTGHSARMQG